MLRIVALGAHVMNTGRSTNMVRGEDKVSGHAANVLSVLLLASQFAEAAIEKQSGTSSVRMGASVSNPLRLADLRATPRSSDTNRN